MVAINSHVILPIARECARRDGDLWVIYMGNNEVIGPFGAVSVVDSRTSCLPLIRASLGLKRTRFGQGLDALLRPLRDGDKTAEEWNGMAMAAGRQIDPGHPRIARGYSNFDSNLAGILAAADGVGVPVILCTVAVNLKDCPPFASSHRPGLTDEQREEWEAAYNEGMALESAGNLAAAIASYERAADVDGHFADLNFRRARCRVLILPGFWRKKFMQELLQIGQKLSVSRNTRFAQYIWRTIAQRIPCSLVPSLRG
jgi:hypothetical protein